jgi:hypothetical protein
MNAVQLQEQQLWDLSLQFYTHAVSSRPKVATKQHLLEYYTLVKLSIACLLKILKWKQRATLRLRIKCNILLAQILVDEVDLRSAEEPPETYLGEAMMLCSNNLDFVHYRYHAEFMMVQLMISRGETRQAVRYITNSPVAETLLFRYLKFQAYALDDPVQAHKLLLMILHSPEFHHCHQESKSFIYLTEISFCIQNGLKPMSDLNGIITLFPLLQAMKLSLASILQLHYPSGDDTQMKKELSLAIDQLANVSSFVLLPFSFNGRLIHLNVRLQSHVLSLIQFHIYQGISGINATQDSSASTKSFEMASRLIGDETSRISNPFMNAIKSNKQDLKRVSALSEDIKFYDTLKSLSSYLLATKKDSDGKKLGVEGPPTDDLTRLLSIHPSLIQDLDLKDDTRRLYLMAMVYHSYGQPDAALQEYEKLLIRLETANPHHKHNELYLFSTLNLYMMVQGCIEHYSRNELSGRASALFRLRDDSTQRLQKIMETPNTSLPQRFLIRNTLQLLTMLFNFENKSSQYINETATQLLQQFNLLKRTPLLTSLLLYVKSVTENKNSDEKQKTSQIAFNLAKFGFYPLMRYITGVLNANNAAQARNLEQVDIQNDKLKKMIPNLETIYGTMFETKQAI